jgi:hypothetical protein
MGINNHVEGTQNTDIGKTKVGSTKIFTAVERSSQSPRGEERIGAHADQTLIAPGKSEKGFGRMPPFREHFGKVWGLL